MLGGVKDRVPRRWTVSLAEFGSKQLLGLGRLAAAGMDHGDSELWRVADGGITGMKSVKYGVTRVEPCEERERMLSDKLLRERL